MFFNAHKIHRFRVSKIIQVYLLLSRVLWLMFEPNVSLAIATSIFNRESVLQYVLRQTIEILPTGSNCPIHLNAHK